MVTAESWLIDKSALVRLNVSEEAERWANRIDRGLIRVAPVTLLELGHSVRPGNPSTVLHESPLPSLLREYATPAIEDRAMELQAMLIDRSQHRGISIPDLLVAATAELVGLTVLHVDGDFDLIARFTDQPVERLNWSQD